MIKPAYPVTGWVGLTPHLCNTTDGVTTRLCLRSWHWEASGPQPSNTEGATHQLPAMPRAARKATQRTEELQMGPPTQHPAPGRSQPMSSGGSKDRRGIAKFVTVTSECPSGLWAQDSPTGQKREETGYS